MLFDLQVEVLVTKERAFLTVPMGQPMSYGPRLSIGTQTTGDAKSIPFSVSAGTSNADSRPATTAPRGPQAGRPPLAVREGSAHLLPPDRRGLQPPVGFGAPIIHVVSPLHARQWAPPPGWPAGSGHPPNLATPQFQPLATPPHPGDAGRAGSQPPHRGNESPSRRVIVVRPTTSGVATTSRAPPPPMVFMPAAHNGLLRSAPSTPVRQPAHTPPTMALVPDAYGRMVPVAIVPLSEYHGGHGGGFPMREGDHRSNQGRLGQPLPNSHAARGGGGGPPSLQGSGSFDASLPTSDSNSRSPRRPPPPPPRSPTSSTESAPTTGPRGSFGDSHAHQWDDGRKEQRDPPKRTMPDFLDPPQSLGAARDSSTVGGEQHPYGASPHRAGSLSERSAAPPAAGMDSIASSSQDLIRDLYDTVRRQDGLIRESLEKYRRTEVPSSRPARRSEDGGELREGSGYLNQLFQPPRDQPLEHETSLSSQRAITTLRPAAAAAAAPSVTSTFARSDSSSRSESAWVNRPLAVAPRPTTKSHAAAPTRPPPTAPPAAVDASMSPASQVFGVQYIRKGDQRWSAAGRQRSEPAAAPPPLPSRPAPTSSGLAPPSQRNRPATSRDGGGGLVADSPDRSASDVAVRARRTLLTHLQGAAD